MFYELKEDAVKSLFRLFKLANLSKNAVDFNLDTMDYEDKYDWLIFLTKEPRIGRVIFAENQNMIKMKELFTEAETADYGFFALPNFGEGKKFYTIHKNELLIWKTEGTLMTEQ